MDDRIASALSAAFPDREVASTEPAGPSWNPTNESVRVDFADGRTAYLKVAVDGDGTRIARERGTIEYIGANCDVRVPAVLSSDADGEVPYLATAPLAGESIVGPWSEWGVAERAETARRVGEALADVHAERFGAHGHIAGGGADGLDLDTAPWTDVLVDTIEDVRALSPSDRFDRHFDEVIAAVEANRDLLDDAPAALLHGDPAMPNCFRGADGIGFLDWEIAHVGDPVRDLHRVRAQQIDGLRSAGDERLVTALHEGYRERAGGLPPGFEERRPVYRAVRFLGTSGFVEKTAEFADESLEEFAAWVDAEMERRLAEI
ncbi:phosphotransferase [Halostella sp. JP-L12]|uniref:phosphotransferase family protein n=1 Tax=Halostella TaxID=1843185 RepID=UPI000EF7AC4E|nr:MULTISPECIES: phosphotransferase [Halostella]NHN47800.1 phosphotransferase [Halostella sp. JP-L12]